MPKAEKGKAPAAGSSGPAAEPRVREPAWKSDLPKNRTIWKTLAKQKYRVNDDDLVGHVHDRKDDRGGNSVYEYLEIVVQIIAWRRYGGPAGYWQMLKAELVAYKQEHGNVEGFRYPYDYRPGGLYDLRKAPPPQSTPSQPQSQAGPSRRRMLVPAPLSVLSELEQDAYVGTSSRLAEVKQQLPSWLWTACNTALDAAYGPPTEPGVDLRLREDAMHVFVASYAAGYPARPPGGVPRTASMAAFYQALDNALMMPDQDSADWGSSMPSLDFVGTPQDGHYEWSEAYLEELFTQLHALVSGVKISWQTLRWAVYDKYTQCLRRGVQYDPTTERWSDKAKCWLDEHQYQAGSEELRSSLRNRCSAGRLFNDLFPIVIQD